MANESATETARDPGPAPAVYRDDYLEHLKKKWDHHQVKQFREAGVKKRKKIIHDAVKEARFRYASSMVDHLLRFELAGRHSFKKIGTACTPTHAEWVDDSHPHHIHLRLKNLNHGVFLTAKGDNDRMAPKGQINLDGKLNTVFDPEDIYRKLADFIVPGVITKDWTTFQ